MAILTMHWIEEVPAEPWMQRTAQQVAEQALLQVECPQEKVCVDVTLTDLEGIRAVNAAYRQIDAPTDVLSFPLLESEREGCPIADPACMDPEDGLMLGDLLVCLPRMREQAQEYGHSERREFAFLVVHGMLHLLGFDHMQPQEERRMFDRQRAVLDALEIRR